ncbi:MAG: CAP domain-containing protein [Selenomonadaceae bacterium]|nr:CAP domain-containing protein [Selenomonadaceae bacterium]
MKKFFMSIVAAVILLVSSQNAYAADDFAVEVLNLVNAERARVGVAPLRLADDLQAASAIRAREIVGYFSHTRPDGSDCFTVMRNRGRTCGENIAAGHGSATETVAQWMDSQGHRENILNPAFKELGVGYAYEDYSDYRHYWVQLFRG